MVTGANECTWSLASVLRHRSTRMLHLSIATILIFISTIKHFTIEHFQSEGTVRSSEIILLCYNVKLRTAYMLNHNVSVSRTMFGGWVLYLFINKCATKGKSTQHLYWVWFSYLKRVPNLIPYVGVLAIHLLPFGLTEHICLTLKNEGSMPKGNCNTCILHSIVRMQCWILCLYLPWSWIFFLSCRELS